MKTIRFEIHGNQEHKDGNPCPYFRVTSQSKFSDGAKRYNEWKKYVRGKYTDALMALDKGERMALKEHHDLLKTNPIANTGKKTIVNLKIHWKDKAHADSDNVFKGIADSLFMNDKYVVGSFDYDYSENKQGSVEVEIIFT